MVKEAVDFALCSGALVVAAAGNNHGGPIGQYDSGPSYPAAWERFESLTGPECAARFGTPAAKAVVDVPLVRSVHALTEFGASIGMVRPGSTTVTGAMGYFAVTGRAYSGQYSHEPTGIVNGTSLATAVVSAAFMGARAMDPTLTWRQAVQAAINGAELTGMNAEWCGRPPCGEVRMIRVAEAMQMACAINGCSWAIQPMTGSGQAIDYSTLMPPGGQSANGSREDSCPSGVTVSSLETIRPSILGARREQ